MQIVGLGVGVTELIDDDAARVDVKLDGGILETLEETGLEIDGGGGPTAEDGLVATLLALLAGTLVNEEVGLAVTLLELLAGPLMLGEVVVKMLKDEDVSVIGQRVVETADVTVTTVTDPDGQDIDVPVDPGGGQLVMVDSTVV